MKKYLPLILVGVGVLVILAVIFVIVKNSKKQTQDTATENVPELAQNLWPVVTLTPTDDAAAPSSMGHFLDFKVEKINVPGAATMDYLLVYSTSDGGQQGVPGSVKLDGSGAIEKKLLMGSASSGKYRYDAGVENGTMTITFRDGNGKSMGKLSADFHLQSNVVSLTSVDGKFTYTLDKAAKNVFFVTMPTFVQPDASEYVAWQNGYGVFASDGKPHTGKVSP